VLGVHVYRGTVTKQKVDDGAFRCFCCVRAVWKDRATVLELEKHHVQFVGASVQSAVLVTSWSTTRRCNHVPWQG